jgi:hypothetical protein
MTGLFTGCHVCQISESSHITGGNIGKGLAIENYSSLFEAMHESRIIQPTQLSGSRDTGNPQGAVFTFFSASIPVGIPHTAMDRFNGSSVQATAAAEISTGALEDFIVPSFSGDIVCCARHSLLSPIHVFLS